MMGMSKGKPDALLIVPEGKGKRSGHDDEEDVQDADQDLDNAVDMLAEAFGIKDFDRKKARAALELAHEACLDKGEGAYENEESDDYGKD